MTNRDYSPVQTLREARGISRNDFALLTGKTYSQIVAAERGLLKKLPHGWASGFEAAGIEFDPIASQYAAWREARTEQVKAAHLGR